MKPLSLIVSRTWKLCCSGGITSVLIILFCLSDTTQAQSLIPELVFKNPVSKTGKGSPEWGRDGAVYLFENVGWGMDAVVTILGRSSAAVTLSNVDIQGPEQNVYQGTGFDNAWQPEIRYGDGTAASHQTWWMEFKISFVIHKHLETFMPVNQFLVKGLDIDGDGKQLHEFQAYYKTKSYSLGQGTAIYASSVRGSETDPLLKGKRFDGPVRNYTGISVTAEDAMVSIFYTGTASMIVRLGAETEGEATNCATRKYGLLFKSMAVGVPAIRTESVNLIAASQSKARRGNE